MLLIIAVLYFLGIQSVASNNCPKLRCTSSQNLSPRNLRLHCSLTPDTERYSYRRVLVGNGYQRRIDSRRGQPTLANSRHASTSALVNGLCVTEFFLSHLHPNDSHTLLSRLVLRQLTGLGVDFRRSGARMLCNTIPTSASPTSAHVGPARIPAWQECIQRVPRFEIVESLASNRNAVCVVCASASSPGDPEVVYHSISRTLLLRVIFRNSDSSSSSPDSSSSSPDSSSSTSFSAVSALSVTLDLHFYDADQPGLRPSSQSTSNPEHGRSTGGSRTDGVLVGSSRRCRWKCGGLPVCLLSEEGVCDGRRHCPDGIDEAWCKRTHVAREKARKSPILGMPLVYALITVGCVLGFVFLILCFLWAFCGRQGPHAPSSSRNLLRRRHRQHHRRPTVDRDNHALGRPRANGDSSGALVSNVDAVLACPSCSPCCSAALVDAPGLVSSSSVDQEYPSAGARCGVVLMEQPSGAYSSSGVFEESCASSAVCPYCGSCRAWLDLKTGELEPKGAAAPAGTSDSSSAISGCASADVESGTVETLICSAIGAVPTPGNQRYVPFPTGSHRCSGPNPDGRNRGSSESIGCHPTSQSRHHLYRSSRSSRRHPQFQGLSLTMPSHKQDWFLNLPASVRRSNDDTDPRPLQSPTGTSSVESGRLLPPPNLNPFLDEPNFRSQVVASGTES